MSTSASREETFTAPEPLSPSPSVGNKRRSDAVSAGEKAKKQTTGSPSFLPSLSSSAEEIREDGTYNKALSALSVEEAVCGEREQD